MPGALILAGHEHEESQGQRFVIGAAELTTYLRCYTGIRCKSINLFDLPSCRVLSEIYTFLLETDGFGLLAYLGHGAKNGWGYHTIKHKSDQRKDNEPEYINIIKYQLDYKRIAELMDVYVSCPLLILNDCCYAGALFNELLGIGPLSQIGFIGASPHDQEAFPFYHQVLEDWRSRKPFAPRKYTVERMHMNLNMEEIVLESEGPLSPERLRVHLDDHSPIETEIRIEPRLRMGENLDHLFFPRHF